MPNEWIEHVKKYAKKHNISYTEALKQAKASYKAPATRAEGAMMPTQLCKVHDNKKDCDENSDECIWYKKKGCSQRKNKTKKTAYAEGGRCQYHESRKDCVEMPDECVWKAKKCSQRQRSYRKRNSSKSSKKSNRKMSGRKTGGGRKSKTPAKRSEGAMMPTQLCKVHDNRKDCRENSDECIWYPKKGCSQRQNKTKKTAYAEGGRCQYHESRKECIEMPGECVWKEKKCSQRQRSYRKRTSSKSSRKTGGGRKSKTPAKRSEGAMMPTQLCKVHDNRKDCRENSDECIWYPKKGCSQRQNKTKKTAYAEGGRCQYHDSRKECIEMPGECVWKEKKCTQRQRSYRKRTSSRKSGGGHKKSHKSHKSHKVSRKQSGGNKWHDHVRAYAKKHGLSYFQALKPARASYGAPATRAEGAMMPTQLCKVHDNKKDCDENADECIWYKKKGCSQRTNKTKKTAYAKEGRCQYHDSRKDCIEMPGECVWKSKKCSQRQRSYRRRSSRK